MMCRVGAVSTTELFRVALGALRRELDEGSRVEAARKLRSLRGPVERQFAPDGECDYCDRRRLKQAAHHERFKEKRRAASNERRRGEDLSGCGSLLVGPRE